MGNWGDREYNISASIHIQESLKIYMSFIMSEITVLPDGSAFAVMSLPLPDDHWLFAKSESGHEKPPIPMRMSTDGPRRAEMRKKLQQAGRYAIRAATMNGKIDDFDPDALIQNLIVGMLGYNTPDGLSRQEEEIKV